MKDVRVIITVGELKGMLLGLLIGLLVIILFDIHSLGRELYCFLH